MPPTREEIYRCYLELRCGGHRRRVVAEHQVLTGSRSPPPPCPLLDSWRIRDDTVIEPRTSNADTALHNPAFPEACTDPDIDAIVNLLVVVGARADEVVS